MGASFNPRARDGRDSSPVIVTFYNFCFNPRARDGRDLRLSMALAMDSAFQSTRP